MAEYRLTTLNLDDECRRILGEQDNQSRYARECITRYGDLVQEFDEMEDKLTAYRYGARALARMLQDFYKMYPDDVAISAFLAEWLRDTDLNVSKLVANLYMPDAIIGELVRRGSL